MTATARRAMLVEARCLVHTAPGDIPDPDNVRRAVAYLMDARGDGSGWRTTPAGGFAGQSWVSRTRVWPC
jgi:hypothetical protein